MSIKITPPIRTQDHMAYKTPEQLLAERNGKTELENALDQYELWFNASQALSHSQSYKIKNGQNSERELTRADSEEIRKWIEYWKNEINKLQGFDNKAPVYQPIFTKRYC